MAKKHKRVGKKRRVGKGKGKLIGASMHGKSLRKRSRRKRA